MAEISEPSIELLDTRAAVELRRLELRTKRDISSDLIGRYRSAFRGSGLTFSDLREYQPGDDVKHIHWKVTARTGKVYVKSYEEDRQLTIILAVDISRSTLFGGSKTKYRRALEFASLVALLAKQNQDAIGMCLFSDEVESYYPPNRKRNQVHRILLDLMTPRTLKPRTDLSGALRYIREHQRRSAIVFILSDFIAPDWDMELRALSFKHDVINVYLEDEIDEVLPRSGITEFVDSETGEHVLLDCSNRAVRARISAEHQAKRDQARFIAKNAGADFVALRDDAFQSLSKLMRERSARIR